jgi:hypothetical protein
MDKLGVAPNCSTAIWAVVNGADSFLNSAPLWPRPRRGEEHPAIGAFPLLLELRAIGAVSGFAGGIVHPDGLLFDAGEDGEVEALRRSFLKADDDRAAFGEVLFEVGPFATESEGLEADLFEIAFHGGKFDALVFGIDQASVNRVRFRGAVAVPVLGNHGDAGCSTAILFLPDEGDGEGLTRRQRGECEDESEGPHQCTAMRTITAAARAMTM